MYGFGDSSLNLMYSYLSHGKHVSIGTTFSDWHHIQSDVPYGSLVGPLLYDIFSMVVYFILRNQKYEISLITIHCMPKERTYE